MHLNWLTDDVLARLRAAEKAPDGTVTMVFTDIVSSTAIKRLLGDTDAERDAAWAEAFQKPHHAVIRGCMDEYEGYEVKTIGDAFFITFADPAKAVRCAVEIQRRIAAANLITPLPGSPPLQVRIGMHTGTPILQDKDYVGTSVDKAARVEGAAHGGQVLLSEQTYALLKGQLSDFIFHSHGEFLLRGLGTHTVFEVLWDGKAPTEPKAQRPPTKIGEEPLAVEVPDDFPQEVFARDLETLRTAAHPDSMHPQEWQEARETVTEEWLAELGRRLFLHLFTEEDVHRRYWETTGELRLKIPARFHALPFELLHDDKDFVALRRSIVRVVDADTRGRRPRRQAEGALKVLVALAAPVLDERPSADENTQPDLFDVDRQADVFRAMRDAPFAAEFRLLPHATRNDLDDALLEDNPTVLHFVGHGGEGTVLFETRHGAADPADHREIERLVDEADALQLVVLESCLTASGGVDVSVAGAVLAGGAPLVIGMQHPITVKAATEFVRAFYRRLTLGGDLSTALHGARRALQRRDDLSAWAWATPVLFWDGEGSFRNPQSETPNPTVAVTEPPRPDLDPILRRDPMFVGRRRERVDIARTLDPHGRGAHKVVVLRAGGGFGKTALAREVVHHVAEWFDGGVLFMGARTYTPDDPIVRLSTAGRVKPIAGDVDFLVQLGRNLGLELTGEEPPDELPPRLVRALDDGRWRLLLLDNLDDIYNSKHLCAFLEILPRTTRALVTTRHNIPAEGTWAVPVVPLPLRDTAEMGLAYGVRAGFIPTPEQMKKLLDRTGGNPLAIKLALSATGESRTPLDGFLRDLEAASGETETLFRYLFDHSVAAAGDDGARVFEAMSLFATHARRDALQAVCGFASDAAFSDAVARAVRLSLMDSIGDGATFILQDIARPHAARLLREDAERKALGERFVAYFVRFAGRGRLLEPERAQERAREELGAEAAPEAVNERAHQIVLGVLSALDPERPNCVRALTLTCEAGDLDSATVIYDGLSWLFTIRSYWSEEVSSLQLMLLAAERAPDASTPSARRRIGMFLNNLGIVYESQGRWSDAEACCQKSLEIRREVGDRVGEGKTLNSLGNVYARQGRWSDAEACHQKSLEIKREVGGRVGEGKTLNNLGLVYARQGQWQKAEACYQKSLEIDREVGDRVGEGITLNNLGIAYKRQGRWAEAEECYQKSLEIKREVGDRVGEGHTLNNLGVLREAQEDIAGALEFGRQAIAVLETTEDKAELERARRLVAEWEKQV